MRCLTTILMSCLSIIHILTSPIEATTLTGIVTDSLSGQPVRFAEIHVLELDAITHTDSDGRYVFPDLPDGSYQVVIEKDGYATLTIERVIVSTRSPRNVNFIMTEATGTQTEETEESPSEEKGADGFQSMRLDPVRFSDLPIRGYEDYIALQPGTVRRYYGAPLHVRGGRIEEFAYDVDGFSQQDPFTGRSFTAINHNSIDDIRYYPGYADVSHGWTASGHAEVDTRETWATGGSLEAITDNFHGDKSDYSLYALDLSGPLIPKTPGMLTYAVAGEYRTIGNRDPGGPEDWNNLGAWHGNLRWRPSEQSRLLIGTRGSYEDWKYTPLEYLFDAVHSPRGTDENYSVFGTLEHEFSQRTKASASLNWFSAEHFQGDATHFDDIWGYGRPSGNPRFEQTRLYWSWDDMLLDPDSQAVGRNVVLHTPVVESTLAVLLPDGDTAAQPFIIRGDEGSVWDDYFKQKGSYVAGRAGLSHAFSPNAAADVGLEFQRHSVRMYHHVFPMLIYRGANGGFDDIDRYGYDELGNEVDEEGTNSVKHPLFTSGFINQRLARDELTLDVGLRLDNFDYDALGLLDPQDPLDPFHHDSILAEDPDNGLTDAQRDSVRQQTNVLAPDELTEIESITRLSPRLQGSLQLADGAVIHLAGGRFVQRPQLGDLYFNSDYLEYKIQTGGYAYTFANPTLEPTDVIEYEAGLSYQVPEVGDLHVSVYTKKFGHLVGKQTRPATPNSFTTIVDAGSATARGLEVSFHFDRHWGLAAQIAYTLSDISDDQLYTNTQDNIAWTSPPPQRLMGPFTFEQEHKFTGTVDLRAGSAAGPAFGDWYPLENVGVTVLFEAGSGFPYTPSQVYNEVSLKPIGAAPAGPLGSERTPAIYRLDVKANKTFAISSVDLEVYFWIINVFDRDNVAFVYSGTGEPDNTGWLETVYGQQFIQDNSAIHDASLLSGEQKYQIRQNDPANFDIPRQIRFGMKIAM